MRVIPSLLLLVGLSWQMTAGTSLRAATGTDVESRFSTEVRPFLDANCASCHGEKEIKGEIDLRPFTSVGAVVADFKVWEDILDMVEAEDMPPAKAKKHPSDEKRADFVAWIKDLRAQESEKNAGDPGPVLARRLSNAEYNYTIYDLTKVDIRPTKEFPVDPANQSGFDNTGESLAMSPALLQKYYDAARDVADHLVLRPQGFAFAPHPVVMDTDRDQYSVARIIDFYRRQPTDYAKYFAAAWRYRYRENLGFPNATLKDVAAADGLSPKYFSIVWNALQEREETVGPLAKLQERWMSLPAPSGKNDKVNPVVEQGCAQMRDFVVTFRRKIVPHVNNLVAPRMIQQGSQTVLMWKNRQMAANRRRFDPTILRTQEEAEAAVLRLAQEKAERQTRKPGGFRPPPSAKAPPDPNAPVLAKPASEDVINRGGKFLTAAVAKGPSTALSAVATETSPDDPDFIIPDDPAIKAQYTAAFTRFADVFPDAFYISERARVYLDPKEEQQNAGRLLSAGFHSMTGYFRDDAPLCDLVLDEAGKQELNALWDEFNFAASIPRRMHTSFVWFERTDSQFMRDREFDPFRPEDKSVTSQEKIKKLSELYLAKAQANGADATVQQAIRDHFATVAENNAWWEKTYEAAIPSHLQDLEKFAERAYRRPLSAKERQDLSAFYQSSRNDNGLDHEDAMRDSIVRILLSPNFCYRMDATADVVVANGRRDGSKVTFATLTDHPSPNSPQALLAPGRELLSNYALASRLSYFLWSSMPDEELLAVAARGELQRPEVLIAQARRMVMDRRIENLATEFVGNWLEFRRFEEHNAVDRERYPNFNDALREAMFQEPLHFFVNVLQAGAPVQDFLFADYTFVNAPLAKHYGITGEFTADRWVKVNEVNRIGRGGFLPMAVFLTANSPGLRTSPVKRGHWLVSRLLGERIPPPPPNVPVLPADEKQMGELTLRQTLERHRADQTCAACHARFDSFGLAFEGYGPTGERRTLDFGARPVDATAEFPGGIKGEGLDGLRDYVRAKRTDDFVNNLSRKLLTYSLSRALLPSDDALLTEMKAKLSADGYRFRALIETIVTSPQFRTKRVVKPLLNTASTP